MTSSADFFPDRTPRRRDSIPEVPSPPSSRATPPVVRCPVCQGDDFVWESMSMFRDAVASELFGVAADRVPFDVGVCRVCRHTMLFRA